MKTDDEKRVEALQMYGQSVSKETIRKKLHISISQLEAWIRLDEDLKNNVIPPIPEFSEIVKVRTSPPMRIQNGFSHWVSKIAEEHLKRTGRWWRV